MRFRDFSRLAGRNFLSKLFFGGGADDLMNAVFNGPYVPGVRQIKKIWEIPPENAIKAILEVAAMRARSQLPDSYTTDHVSGWIGKKSNGEYRALLALADENQRRETCLQWIAEAKAAYKPPSNSGVAVPHLRA